MKMIFWYTSNVAFVLSYINLHLSDFGSQWAPAVINDQEELDFLQRKQTVFTDQRSYWISGSTDQNNFTLIDFSMYRNDTSGKNDLQSKTQHRKFAMCIPYHQKRQKCNFHLP